MRLTRLGLISILSVALAQSLHGGDGPATVCDRDPSSALAFVGILTELRSGTAVHQADFRVIELLHGESPDVVTVTIFTGTCEDSGSVPKIGRTYLVRTRRSRIGATRSSPCEQLRAADQAVAEIEYLRRSRGGETPTEIVGEARVEKTGVYQWKEIALPGTKIRLVGQQQRYEFVSDEDGRFRGILAPGKYKAIAEFPHGYEVPHGYEAQGVCGPSVTVAVDEHQCTEVTVCAHPTASITVHIVDVDGEQLDSAFNVELILATADDNELVDSGWPDEESKLKLEGLLPGQYVLGLNTDLPVNRGSAPYPPTYFPGVSRRSEAEVITVAPGEHRILQEMRIKKGQACEIPVITTDALGRPAPSIPVGLAYPDYPHFWLTPGEETNNDGRGTVYAVFPGTVLLRAVIQHADGSSVQSEVAELNSCPANPVQLRLTRIVKPEPQKEKQ